MEKYRLIKTYPGSPGLGSFVKKDKLNNKVYCLEGHSYTTFNLKNIENNPEYWKKIEGFPIGTLVYNSQIKSTLIKRKDGWYKIPEEFELKTSYTDSDILNQKIFKIVNSCKRDYQVLTIIDINNPELIYTWNGTNFRHKFSCIVPESLKWDNIKIHSVKRLSDGEIFSINDRCTSSISYTPLTLNDISIKNNQVFFYLGYSDTPIKLKNIKKNKTFLLKTENGVDIFESDYYYTVRNDFSLAKDGNGFHSKGLHFSTKEKAEEYLLMNKPCLSINDIMSVVNSYSSRLTADVFRRLLKDFIKNK